MCCLFTACERVLSRTLKLESASLSAQLVQAKKHHHSHNSAASNTTSQTPLDIPKHVTIIHVYDVAPTTNKEVLKKFFESRHRSGGGTVNDIRQEGDHWTVNFGDEEGKE